MKKKPRSFTSLLKVTKLPRKTLSIRLKQLVNSDVLTKDGLYYLNDAADTEDLDLTKKKPFLLGKRVLLAFLVMAIILPASFQAYALFQPEPSLEIKGYFTASLYVYGVEDLYGWQAVIAYDTNNTKVVEAVPGDFLATAYPLFVNANIPEMGIFLVGQSLLGEVSGKNGDGLLTTIVFAYYSEEFKPPELLPKLKWRTTRLLTSNEQMIPLDSVTLTIDIDRD